MKLLFELFLFVCAAALIVLCALAILAALLGQAAINNLPRIAHPIL
jgi:hypothetical protein